MLFRRRSPLTTSQSTALARVLHAPTFELVPLQNALEQAAFLSAGATVSGTASPAKGIEATVALCEQLQALGFRRTPPLGPDASRPRPSRRADRVAGGGRRGPGVHRGWRRQGAGRLSGRPLVAARDGRDRPSVVRDRDPVLPTGPLVHRRRAAARGAPRQGRVRELT